MELFFCEGTRRKDKKGRRREKVCLSLVFQNDFKNTNNEQRTPTTEQQNFFLDVEFAPKKPSNFLRRRRRTHKKTLKMRRAVTQEKRRLSSLAASTSTSESPALVQRTMIRFLRRLSSAAAVPETAISSHQKLSIDKDFLDGANVSSSIIIIIIVLEFRVTFCRPSTLSFSISRSLFLFLRV